MIKADEDLQNHGNSWDGEYRRDHSTEYTVNPRDFNRVASADFFNTTGEEVVARVGSARLYVCAHKTKRFIVAIKYAEEESYRYLIASDLSWRTLDIVQGHTLRWLVEVFIQDWKSYEGWSQLTKQPGDEGARHSVILSLLVDHSLFLHPDQQRQLKNNLPAYTVGSLRAHVQVEC